MSDKPITQEQKDKIQAATESWWSHGLSVGQHLLHEFVAEIESIMGIEHKPQPIPPEPTPAPDPGAPKPNDGGGPGVPPR